MAENNVVVFTRNGIHFDENKARRDTTAVFVPSREQVRRFTDIGTVNARTVRDRYGDVGQIPLWRAATNSVTVYGLLPQELQERRRMVEVLLPQDFAPANCSVFYYVFGNRNIVHGVKAISEDGVESWESSRIDAGEGKVVETVVAAVSERVAEAKTENITIACHGDEEVMKELQSRLEAFNLDVVRFQSLSRRKEVKPLYSHRDYGMVYMIAAAVGLVALGVSSIFTVQGFFNLQEMENRIQQLETQIQETQTSTKLGNVRNPNAVLEFMSKPLAVRPSSILHAAGDAATSFGVLRSLDMDATRMETRRVVRENENGRMVPTTEKIINVGTTVHNEREFYLLDQENVAKNLLENAPWIRYIERRRGGNQGDLTLEMGVYVE